MCEILAHCRIEVRGDEHPTRDVETVTLGLMLPHRRRVRFWVRHVDDVGRGKSQAYQRDGATP